MVFQKSAAIDGPNESSLKFMIQITLVQKLLQFGVCSVTFLALAFSVFVRNHSPISQSS